MGFPLILMVASVLFLMPSAFSPDLAEVPVFEVLILACAAASFPQLAEQLTSRSLAARPITVCLLGLWASVGLSHLSKLDFYYTRQMSETFAKFVVLYFVLVANVDSPARLRLFLSWVALMIAALATCSLLQYHGYAYLSDQLEPLRREQDSGEPSGGPIFLRQLRGVGFFADPNDVSLVLVIGILIAVWRVLDGRSPSIRFAWLVPLAILAAAFPLTYSRGGLVSLLAGVLALLVGRFGARRSVPIALMILPALLLLLAGRQTELGTSGGTAQERIQFWVMGLSLYRKDPLFGIGSGMYPDHIGHEAHNSFVQALVELGTIGGACYLGIFSYALSTLYRLGRPGARIADDELRRVRPYLLGVVASYVGGMISLTRVYVMPTYLVAGLATAYLRVAAPSPPPPPFDSRFVRRLAIEIAVFIVGIHIYVRTFARFTGGQ